MTGQTPDLRSQAFDAVVFVCAQNICRSAAAELVFKYLRDETGLPLRVASAGIDADENRPPMVDLATAAKQRGYDTTALRSRRLSADDLKPGTLIVAVDRNTATAVESMLARMPADDARTVQVTLLGRFAQTFAAEFERNEDLRVPSNAREAQAMLDRIEDACLGLLNGLLDTARARLL